MGSGSIFNLDLDLDLAACLILRLILYVNQFRFNNLKVI